MLLSGRSLLRQSTLLASTVLVPPLSLFSMRSLQAQEPVSTGAIVYQAVVTVIGALNSQKFSSDVRGGLDDIKAQRASFA